NSRTIIKFVFAGGGIESKNPTPVLLDTDVETDTGIADESEVESREAESVAGIKSRPANKNFAIRLCNDGVSAVLKIGDVSYDLPAWTKETVRITVAV